MIDPNPLRMPADGVSTQPYLFAPPLLAKLQPIEPLFTPLPDANSQAKLYLSTLAARRTEAITALSSLSTPPNEVQSAVALYLALAAPFLTGMPDQQASSPSTEAAAAGAPGTLHGLSDVPATPPPAALHAEAAPPQTQQMASLQACLLLRQRPWQPEQLHPPLTSGCFGPLRKAGGRTA